MNGYQVPRPTIIEVFYYEGYSENEIVSTDTIKQFEALVRSAAVTDWQVFQKGEFDLMAYFAKKYSSRKIIRIIEKDLDERWQWSIDNGEDPEMDDNKIWGVEDLDDKLLAIYLKNTWVLENISGRDYLKLRKIWRNFDMRGDCGSALPSYSCMFPDEGEPAAEDVQDLYEKMSQHLTDRETKRTPRLFRRLGFAV